jgi:hypothetical protein
MPRPTRFTFFRDPFGGFNSFNLIYASLISLFYFYQMNDTIDHSPDLRPVRQRKGLMESFKTKTPNGLLLVADSADRTPHPFDGNHFTCFGLFSFPLLLHDVYPLPLREPSIG